MKIIFTFTFLWSTLLESAVLGQTHPDIVKIITVPGGVTPGGAGWADSYSVGDRCYCQTNFDHDIGPILVAVPFMGMVTVKEACNLLGAGPGSSGRPIYNDVQCGNGPANNAGDEQLCPGRVDIGESGCGHIGPVWNFDFLTPTSPSSPVAAPSEAPTPSCFSASATVETRDRGTVAMKDLQVGDWVYSGQGSSRRSKYTINAPRYQPIYSFGHYHESWKGTFLQIQSTTTSDVLPPRYSSSPLEMTGNHMAFAVGTNGQYQAVRADSLEVGDILVREEPHSYYDSTSSRSLNHQHPHQAKVTKICSITKQGVYMPLTPDGTLIVNGIKVSSYVSLQDEAPCVVRNSFLLTEETVLHWWLAPFRMLCMGVSSKFCGSKKNHSFKTDDEGILQWLLYGKQLAEFADQQDFCVRVLFIEAPLFCLFGCFILVEFLFGPSMAPTVLALAGVGICFYWKHMRKNRETRKMLE